MAFSDVKPLIMAVYSPECSAVHWLAHCQSAQHESHFTGVLVVGDPGLDQTAKAVI